MTKEQVQAEISALEEQAKQMIANANAIQGAIQAYHKVIGMIEAEAKKEE